MPLVPNRQTLDRRFQNKPRNSINCVSMRVYNHSHALSDPRKLSVLEDCLSNGDIVKYTHTESCNSFGLSRSSVQLRGTTVLTNSTPIYTLDLCLLILQPRGNGPGLCLLSAHRRAMAATAVIDERYTGRKGEEADIRHTRDRCCCCDTCC